MATTKSVTGQSELSSDNLKMSIWCMLMYYRGSTRSPSCLYVSCKSAACKQCFWTDLLKCSDSWFYICSGSQRGFVSSVVAHLYSFKSSEWLWFRWMLTVWASVDTIQHLSKPCRPNILKFTRTIDFLLLSTLCLWCLEEMVLLSSVEHQRRCFQECTLFSQSACEAMTVKLQKG